eukprot:COSAG04_NODE_282_length_18189_cov_7.893145_11_plen_121_part_00
MISLRSVFFCLCALLLDDVHRCVRGSKKALLCVEGNRRTYEYCASHNIPIRKTGKLIVAVDDSEVGRLKDIFERGKKVRACSLRSKSFCCTACRSGQHLTRLAVDRMVCLVSSIWRAKTR